MTWISGIQAALDYIEDHITEEIDYDDLARIGYSSRYHFQRVFSILAGMTLGEYIRARRLTLAGAELNTTGAKVIDIALKYGYESPDSFTKAFSKFHGMTPSEAREPGATLTSFSRLSIQISLNGGNTMNYRIEEKDTLLLTGYKCHFTGTPGARLDDECDFYVHTRPLQYILKGLAGDHATDYNIVIHIDDNGYDFYIAALLEPVIRDHLHDPTVLGEEFADKYETVVIDHHLYAIFETERSQYPTMTFLELRRRIASEWLPSSGYRLSDAPELVVTHWYDGDRKQDRYRELWIPIEKDE